MSVPFGYYDLIETFPHPGCAVCRLLQRDGAGGKARPQRGQHRQRRHLKLANTVKHEQRGRRRHIAVQPQHFAFMIQRALAQR